MSARMAFVLTATLILALGACGDTGPPGAAEIYADAGEAMAALTSYHVTVDGQDEGVPFGIELDLILPDSFQATFAFDEGDELFELSVIGIGDELYLQFGDFSSDWFIAPEEERGGFDGTAAFTTALTTEISDLTYLGEEDLDGVATYHLQGTLAREVLELVELGAQLPENVMVELWVGKEDSLVRRYVLAPDIADERTTFTLSRFDDEAISVAAPANPRPAEELEELFGPPFETPEDVQEAIEGLSTEERECLVRVLGADAFAELASGTRVPTDEEFEQGEECFVE